MTWRLDGKTWEYCDEEGHSVACMKHDGEQYRDGMGHPLGKKYDDARRDLEESITPKPKRLSRRTDSRK